MSVTRNGVKLFNIFNKFLFPFPCNPLRRPRSAAGAAGPKTRHANGSPLKNMEPGVRWRPWKKRSIHIFASIPNLIRVSVTDSAAY